MDRSLRSNPMQLDPQMISDEDREYFPERDDIRAEAIGARTTFGLGRAGHHRSAVKPVVDIIDFID